MAHGVAASEPAADPRPYGAADTAFGLDLLAAWCRAGPQANVVLSPASLASGLGMAYLGARGGTARVMAGVLHLPAASTPAASTPAAGTAAAEGKLEAGLRARSGALRGLSSPGVTVSVSDQVWADPGLPPRAAYLNSVATGYDAGVAQVPLLHDPGRAAQEINQTIATATRGHIPHLLPPGSLNGMGWVLTDAQYLNAAWATPFSAAETSSGSFTTAGGQQVTARYMHGDGYRMVTAGGWTAVSLPYRGGRLAMEALLPARGAGNCAMPPAAALAAMRAGLGTSGTAAPGAGGAAGGAPRWAAIGLPKVNLSRHTSMKGLLTALGMGVAFTPAADFTGLSQAACCIGLVEHAATLQVGEKGTVASAATAVGVLPTSGYAGPVVSFDRPYLMLVTDTATGDTLFAARVANPAAH
jgi:serpin B